MIKLREPYLEGTVNPEMKKHILLGMMLSAMLFLVMGAPAFAQEEAGPVEKISYEGSFQYYENTGGEQSEDGTCYIYPAPQPQPGDKLFVTRGGQETEYTLIMDPDSDEDMFISKDGDKIPVEKTSREIQGERLKITSDQETKHWTAGGENFATVSYGGAECQVAVSVLASPVEEITFEPNAEEHFYSMSTDSADKNGYYGMWFDFERGDIIEVSYKNGADAQTFRYTSDPEDADKKVWVEDGNESNILPHGAVAFASDQDRTKWNIENPADNYIYVTYLGGRSQHIHVTLYNDIQNAKVVLEKTVFTYTGKTIVPPAVKSVTYDGRELVENVDYVVSTPDEEYFWIGEYGILIEGQGIYGGSLVAEYSIVPKGSSVKSVKAGKKNLTVKWRKQSAKMQTWRSAGKEKHVDGYEIQVSTSSNFTGKTTKTVKVKGYAKTTRTISDLKPGKRYYVRVRTFTDSGETKMTSGWSKSTRSSKVK